jgi:hypothetical protein
MTFERIKSDLRLCDRANYYIDDVKKKVYVLQHYTYTYACTGVHTLLVQYGKRELRRENVRKT